MTPQIIKLEQWIATHSDEFRSMCVSQIKLAEMLSDARKALNKLRLDELNTLTNTNKPGKLLKSKRYHL